MDNISAEEIDRDSTTLQGLMHRLRGLEMSPAGLLVGSGIITQIDTIRDKYTRANCNHAVIHPINYLVNGTIINCNMYACRLCNQAYLTRDGFPAESIVVDLCADEV